MTHSPMHGDHSPLLGVVGYSTRALVEALSHLGISAISIDAFGDQDTHDLAQAAYVVDRWPDGIVDCARQLPVDGWLLAGGMENCCDTIARLSDVAPVLGPTPTQMRQLRELTFWQQIVRDLNGIGFPRTQADSLDGLHASDDPESTWLFKPRSGSGGLFVQTVTEAGSHSRPGGYYQQFMAGRVLGVTWVLDDRDAHLIGVTESLSDTQWPGPSRFIYRGSIGPIPIRAMVGDALTALGRRVKLAISDYRGWLQADLIEDRAGHLWLLELNPRWTAGMEILHQCASTAAQSPLASHLQAWDCAPNLIQWPRSKARLAAKAVYYAPTSLWLTGQELERLQSLRNWQAYATPTEAVARANEGGEHFDCVECSIADVPMMAAGSERSFAAGEPVLTYRVRVSELD